jgi:hypothetical protein
VQIQCSNPIVLERPSPPNRNWYESGLWTADCARAALRTHATSYFAILQDRQERKEHRDWPECKTCKLIAETFVAEGTEKRVQIVFQNGRILGGRSQKED